MIDVHAAKEISRGLLTFIPGLSKLAPKKGTGGGTDSASYCYGVWLKHITFLHQNGLAEIPKSVVELGPGRSLGVGIASLLSGTDCYYALDQHAYADVEGNLNVLENLLELFKQRSPRPTKGWPDFDKYLTDSLFPNKLLSEERLNQSLQANRVDAIRKAIANPGSTHDGISINYVAPWTDSTAVRRHSCSLVLSQSVLEYVPDLPECYQTMHDWLAPGGYMSHQIDLKSHGTSAKWNGFRTYSELTWNVICGRRSFRINRAPFTEHLQYAREAGFELLQSDLRQMPNTLTTSQLSSKWKRLSDEELSTSGIFLQARR